MSWSASTPETLENADDVNPSAFSTSPSDLADGPRSQFETAVEAAKHLADQVEGPMRISASGHSNADGNTGALEHTTVSISQIKVSETD